MRNKSYRSPLKYEKLYDDWKDMGGSLWDFSCTRGYSYATLKENFDRIESERLKAPLLVVR